MEQIEQKVQDLKNEIKDLKIENKRLVDLCLSIKLILNNLVKLKL